MFEFLQCFDVLPELPDGFVAEAAKQHRGKLPGVLKIITNKNRRDVKKSAWVVLQNV